MNLFENCGYIETSDEDIENYTNQIRELCKAIKNKDSEKAISIFTNMHKTLKCLFYRASMYIKFKDINNVNIDRVENFLDALNLNFKIQPYENKAGAIKSSVIYGEGTKLLIEQLKTFSVFNRNLMIKDSKIEGWICSNDSLKAQIEVILKSNPFKNEIVKKEKVVRKPKEKKEYSLKNQKYETIDDKTSDPPKKALYIFYSSLYDEKPESNLAIKWLTEHGAYPNDDDKRSVLVDKYSRIK